MKTNKSNFAQVRTFGGTAYQLLIKLEKGDESEIEQIKQKFREQGYTHFRIAKSTIVNTTNKALYGKGSF